MDVDLRYVDYADAALFGQSVRDGGLGWRSCFVAAVGGQYEATERLTFRAGYLYDTNPIPSTLTLFNIQLPGIVSNTMSLGASYELTEDILLSAALVHGFRSSVQGNVVEETGAFSKFDTQYDSIVAGLNIRFGGKRRARATPAREQSGPLAGAEHRGGTADTH